jgi:hypothetical protein
MTKFLSNSDGAYATIDLDLIKDSILNTVTIKEFVSKYVPLLFDPNPQMFNLAWIEKAGSELHEVLLLNDRREKVMLIPPLREVRIGQPFINNEVTSALTVYDIRKDIAGISATNDLLTTLSKTNMAIGTTIASCERWKQVLIACGLEDRLNELPGMTMKDVNKQEHEDDLWL